MVKDRIEVAYDKEFDEILDRLGLRDELESGALRCGFCNQPLNFGNVLGVYSDSGKILLCCDRPDCGVRIDEKTATAAS